MKETINIYCDESCHLEHNETAMVLGAVSCPEKKVYRHNTQLRKIKEKFCVSVHRELKWTKISPAKEDLYREVLNYYFDQEDLRFRGVVIPDKRRLRHEDFGQTHDDWYYKMYFTMLKTMICPEHVYNVYLDIKDTCSKNKIDNLHKILCGSKYDFDREIIKKIATVRSHEVELMGITDLLIGALSHLHRNLTSSIAKQDMICHIQQRTKMDLRRSSLPSAQKFNLFIWQPQRGENG